MPSTPRPGLVSQPAIQKELKYPPLNNNVPAISYSPPSDQVQALKPAFPVEPVPSSLAYIPPPIPYAPPYNYYPPQPYYPNNIYEYAYANAYYGSPMRNPPSAYNFHPNYFPIHQPWNAANAYSAPYSYPAQWMRQPYHFGNPRNSYYRFPMPRSNAGPAYWQTGYPRYPAY